MEELEQVKGIVFNIQHYCIHDGPGIRTNVFVKGCPLRCQWCANPESQQKMPQLMYLEDKCVGCGVCIETCEKGAIVRREDTPDKVRTDRSKCVNCGRCVEHCPGKAREISGGEMTAGEAFREVEGDRLFYGSDGGVTVTGGEALTQPEFTKALVTLCHRAGITTAVETCGAVTWQVMEPVLRETDTVLYDIKQMDSALHREYTGVGNERILENLERISRESHCTLVVRCPVIPGCNDQPENFHALGRFLKEKAIRCQEIHLLPYHNLGVGKRQELEPEEAGFVGRTPTEEEMEAKREVLRGYGFEVK